MDPHTPPPRIVPRSHRWEFPVVLVLVLGLIAAATAWTARAGSTVDDFPRNAATALWPVDGSAVDIAFASDGVAEPGTTENAWSRGYEGLAGVPAGMANTMYQPEGDPELSHWWRQTSVRFNDLDRRIQLRQATTEGTRLYTQSWGWRGITFGPALLEVPADVSAGASWESSGEAGFFHRGGREMTDYHNTSRAEPPPDPAEADRGCLVITSHTELVSLQIDETSLWCPDQGIVRQEGTWAGQPYSFAPDDAATISEHVRQDIPLPEVSDDPRSWETGWVTSPVEDDPVFGVDEPVVVPIGEPVVGPLALISVASQFNGDVLTLRLSHRDTSQYPAGTPVVQWRARPGAGDVVTIGTHGELVTAATTDGRLSMIGGNGARRWTIQLSEVAMAAPISLGPDRIAVATLDGRVRVLDVGSGDEVWNTTASQQGISMPLASDGRTIAAVDEGYQLVLLDAETGEVFSRDMDFGQPVNDLAVVDGMAIVTAGNVMGIDVRSGKARWSTEMSVPQDLAVSGDRVAVTSLHEVHILDTATGERIHHMPATTSIVGVQGGFFALRDGRVTLLDTTGEIRHTWLLDDAPATELIMGAGRVWAFDRGTLTGWWVQP